VEIERKFLVPDLPEGLEGYRSEEIEQGYLAVGAESEVRIRRIGEAVLLTVKRGSGGRRLEEEIEITAGQYRRLWPLSEGLRVTKRRFYVPVDDLVAEVDVYSNDLESLVTAEVEFPSEDRSRAFEPPAWFGGEVTGDPRFANKALARDGLPEASA
jgi:CYTH domain-containing protein